MLRFLWHFRGRGSTSQSRERGRVANSQTATGVQGAPRHEPTRQPATCAVERAALHGHFGISTKIR